MKSRRRLIVANWKMYIDAPLKGKRLWSTVSRTAGKLKRSAVVMCPPMGILSSVAPSRGHEKALLGSQDIFWSPEPARTGETSPYLLRSLGVRFALVGHSERRALGETDDIVSAKARAALSVQITPIICVGEHARDHHGNYFSHLEKQIVASCASVPKKSASKIVIAYEPIWAIGKSANDAMTPEALHETTLFIKKTLVRLYGRKIGVAIPILYGGSVEPANIEGLVARGTVDGFLVGHASVDATSFRDIFRAVDALYS